MNSNASHPNLPRRFLWPALAAAALLVWTVYCHVQWLRMEISLHGLVAFFVGLLVLLIVNLVVQLCRGAWQRGWRWLISRGALRLCAWTIAFGVSLVVLFYSVELWRGKNAWASVVQEAEERGEPLSYEDIIPAPVPDEQNFAKAPVFAPLSEWTKSSRAAGSEANTGDGFWIFNHPGLPYEGWHTKSLPWLDQEMTDVRAYAEYYLGAKQPSLTEESAAATALLDGLSKYATNLAQVREFSSRPYCRFQIPYERQMTDSPWHFQALGEILALLQRRASANLILGASDSALVDVQLALRMVEYSLQQPWAGSSRSRKRMVANAVQAVWEGLAVDAWSEGQLAALQEQLEALNVFAEYPAQRRTDALCLSAFLESFIPTSPSSQPLDLDMAADDRRVLDRVRWFYPVGWSLQNQAAIRRSQLREIPLSTDHANQPLAREWEGFKRALFSSSDPLFPVFVMPKVRELAEVTVNDFLFAQTAVNQAILACALERYRLENGEFPETLEALSPRYTREPPADLITGEPLKYRRVTRSAFVLYSVGLNNRDDGGTPAPREKDWQGVSRSYPDLSKDDWVWAYPQTQRNP